MEKFEGSEEPVDNLRAEFVDVKKKYNNLEERVAEGQLWQMDVEDKVNVVRKGVCGKIKCITEAMGCPDLYNPPSP